MKHNLINIALLLVASIYHTCCMGFQPRVQVQCDYSTPIQYTLIQFGNSNKFIYQTYTVNAEAISLTQHDVPSQNSVSVIASRRIYDDQLSYSLSANNSLLLSYSLSLNNELWRCPTAEVAFNTLRNAYLAQQSQNLP